MLKNFDGFKEYMKQNGAEISKSISCKTDKYINDNDIENLMIYSNTYTQVALMEMLEHYHKWLNGES